LQEDDVVGDDPSNIPVFPMKRVHPFDPAPEYARSRQQAPFTRIRLWDGNPAWLATRYDDVLQILQDPRFSQVPTHANYPFPSESRALLLRTEQRAVNQMDPPEHTTIRRMFSRMFTVKNIEALRPKVQQMVDSLLDDMLASGSPADFYKSFALPLPSWVIAELLGVPHKDHAFFQRIARARFFHDGDPQAPLVAGEQIWAYLDQLIKAKEADPGDGKDVIGRLVIEQIRPGHLSHDEAVVHVRQLLLAGHDTTANMIALGTLTLFENPDQLEQLKADPGLVPNAVEEMLRYLTIAQFNSGRVALEDIEISGHVIKKGEGVVASLAAANRDPSHFPNPDHFDILRDAAPQVAFAFGVHSCIGQPLARLELQIVFETLFKRVPTLHLAIPFEEVEFTGNSTQAYGVHVLPVAW
jgi:cytochrome P450